MRAWWMMLGVLVGCTDKAPTDVESSELLDRYVLSDAVGFPEGVSFLPDERAFFMSSLEHGSVTRLDADGTETRIHEPAAGWTSLGTKADPARGEVLMCAVFEPSTDNARSELWVLDAEGLIGSVELMGTPNNCNDLELTDDAIYLTDREAGRLHRVERATSAASIWLEDETLDPELIGMNGIVRVGDALLVGKYAPPRLFRVPLDAPESFTEVSLSGDLGALPDGFDGITVFNDELWIAGNRNLVRLASTDGWSTATATTTQPEVAIAAVTEAEGRVYGLKGEIVSSVLGLEADLPFELVALDP